MDWFTADWHLGHNSILDKYDRPFASIQSYMEEIRNAYSVVGKRDTVYFLGDIILSKSQKYFDFIQSLPGKKVLIAGNHDSIHPMNRTTKIFSSSSRRWYETFDYACTSLQYNDFTLCHFPPIGDHIDEERFPEWRTALNHTIHGHVHDAWRVKFVEGDYMFFNVGLCNADTDGRFRLFNLDMIKQSL